MHTPSLRAFAGRLATLLVTTMAWSGTLTIVDPEGDLPESPQQPTGTTTDIADEELVRVSAYNYGSGWYNDYNRYGEVDENEWYATEDFPLNEGYYTLNCWVHYEPSANDSTGAR